MTNSGANYTRVSAATGGMVVSGGIGRIHTALDLADTGLKKDPIEQPSCLDEYVAQLGCIVSQHNCVHYRGTPDHGYCRTRSSVSPAYTERNQRLDIPIVADTRGVDAQGRVGDPAVSLCQSSRFGALTRHIRCGYGTNGAIGWHRRGQGPVKE